MLNAFIVYWLPRRAAPPHHLPSLPVGGYVAGAILAAQGLAGEAPTTSGAKAVLAVGAGVWLLWLLSMVLVVVLLIVAGASS